MARYLLFEKKLFSKFWAEAINTMVYLLNRLLKKTLKNKTPYEVWNGVKPFVKYLKVFGSICYSLVLEPKRIKLDNRVNKGILVVMIFQLKGIKFSLLKITNLF